MAEASGAAGAEGAGEFIRLLEAALAPIEPPARLADELEQRLAEMQAAALDELHDWEMGAMRDPRNWVRPAAAVAVGTAAGAALLVLRMRHARRQQAALPKLAERARRDLLEAVSDARSRLR
jgi:hypothetical protein